MDDDRLTVIEIVAWVFGTLVGSSIGWAVGIWMFF